MAENKVQFNLKNVHYSILTETETGGVYSESFATPVAVKGAVSLDLQQAGEMTEFYADGLKYFIAQSNQGYSGSIEFARIPDTMLADVWGMTADSSGVIVENANVQFKNFALMFQIDGDANNTLYTLYKCSANRPPIASKTNEETKEPQTQSLDLTCAPLLSNSRVSARTSATTATTVANGWFGAVYTA